MTQQQADRILFVCTANMCRSPMAQTFARQLRTSRSLPVEIASAGLMEAGQPATKYTLKVLARRGLDAGDHRSEMLPEALLEEPDLIAAMSFGHVQAVAELSEKLLDRTFVLKHLVALAEAEGPRREEESLEDYLAKLKAAGSGELSSATPAYDVVDPIGRPLRFYNQTADEIQDLVTRMFDHLWPHRT